MTDWRSHFPDDSRVSWDGRVAVATGTLWPLARPFVEAWRYDSTLQLARSMEDHFRGIDGLADDDAHAVESASAAVRVLLRQAGVTRLRLYRGQPAEPAWSKGATVVVRRRALTSWSPDRPVAVGHAGRVRPAAVLEAEVDVE